VGKLSPYLSARLTSASMAFQSFCVSSEDLSPRHESDELIELMTRAGCDCLENISGLALLRRRRKV